MTERLADVTQRIGNVHQLEAVVTAMRGISISRVQQAHALLQGVRSYAIVIANAIGQARPLVPEKHHNAAGRETSNGTILFCAEQGFAGSFSDRMLKAAGPNLGSKDVFLIGTRGATLAQEQGLLPVWRSAMVPQAILVPALARRIADAVYNWISDRHAPLVDIIVPTWSAADGLQAVIRPLLPFDFRRFAPTASVQAPLTTLPPAVLLERLAEEYIFAELCEAVLTAFMAENEARVATMQSAKANLQDMLSGLQSQERQIRQEEITAEVLELATGAAAR